MDDILAFGLTCRRTWPFARQRLWEWLRKRVGPWAGEQLVAVNNPCDGDDYPPGLFSASEIDALKGEYVQAYPRHHRGALIFWQFEISSFALREVVGGIRMPDPTPVSALMMMLDKLTIQGRADAALDAVEHEICIDMSMYAPVDEAWMLRNLTTKEFVRAEAVAIEPGHIRGPHIEKRGFHHLLLLRTCWDNPACRTAEKFGLPVPARGAWAGHRFEICTAKHHEEDVEKTRAEWSDGSEQAAAELDTLWEAAYGPNWRKVVCDPRWTALVDSAAQGT